MQFITKIAHSLYDTQHFYRDMPTTGGLSKRSKPFHELTFFFSVCVEGTS